MYDKLLGGINIILGDVETIFFTLVYLITPDLSMCRIL